MLHNPNPLLNTRYNDVFIFALFTLIASCMRKHFFFLFIETNNRRCQFSICVLKYSIYISLLDLSLDLNDIYFV